MYRIYSIALGLGLLLALPYYALRFRKYLPTIPERLGWIPASPDRPIWIHAVSVGELHAVDPLIRSLRERLPGQPLLVSTTTPTGRALALGRDDIDGVVYFPLDLPSAVRRVLGRTRPRAVIVAETEIWPNFLRRCGAEGIPVFMVNGRISDRSFARYRLARGWLVRVLEGYTLLGMQTEGDAARIRSIGAPAARVVVFGNLKYDMPRLSGQLDSVLENALASWQPLLVAASTAAGEEPLILDAFREVERRHAGLKLLVAPRRPERFAGAGRALDAAGFEWTRRSSLASGPPGGKVLLLDTVGELPGVFRFATVVFMGGTLVPRGGHNILEAARCGKPVVFGPHMENFREMAREFLEEGAALEVRTPEDLAHELDRLLSDEEAARAMAESGLRLLEKNRGATGLALDRILASIPGLGVRTPVPDPVIR